MNKFIEVRQATLIALGALNGSLSESEQVLYREFPEAATCCLAASLMVTDVESLDSRPMLLSVLRELYQAITGVTAGVVRGTKGFITNLCEALVMQSQQMIGGYYAHV